MNSALLYLVAIDRPPARPYWIYTAKGTSAGMKQALSNLATVLCVLMLVISSLSCSMGEGIHAQMPGSSCMGHQPLNQQTPACCDAHRQPSATAAVIRIEQPTHASALAPSVIHLNLIAILLSPKDQLIWPPPLLSIIKLRI
jgi:hypothetical protein